MSQSSSSRSTPIAMAEVAFRCGNLWRLRQSSVTPRAGVQRGISWETAIVKLQRRTAARLVPDADTRRESAQQSFANGPGSVSGSYIDVTLPSHVRELRTPCPGHSRPELNRQIGIVFARNEKCGERKPVERHRQEIGQLHRTLIFSVSQGDATRNAPSTRSFFLPALAAQCAKATHHRLCATRNTGEGARSMSEAICATQSRREGRVQLCCSTR